MKINKSNPSRILLWSLVLIIVFTGGFYLGSKEVMIPGFSNGKNSSYSLSGNLKENQNGVNVNLLWEVWNTLEREHIDSSNLDGQNLLYGAAKGLVSGLDDGYTTFLTPEETREYESSNKREFQGIGTTLALDGEYVVIESPIDGSPAERSGLKAKDMILEVDGKEVRGKSVVEVATLIRGDAGTQVKIKYFRRSSNETKDIEITRQVIDLENMTLDELENGLMVLKVYQFTEADVATFNREWDRNINQVVQKNPKGLIIDLRNNPGGFVDAVRYSLSEFVEPGKVVFMEEDKNGKRVSYQVSRKGKLLEIPIVVLVNEGSASSSEIFAGAIQDLNRGEIVGTKTVGKGVEQKLIDLSDGSMLQVVFQKWLTSSGRNINGDEPITPDHLVDGSDAQMEKALELLR